MTSSHENHALDVVHRLTMAIAAASDLDQIYDLVLDCAAQVLHVEKASIMVFDPAIGALRVVAARGMDPELMKTAVVRIGDGISGKVFSSHEPLLIEDIRTSPIGPRPGRYRTNSLMAAPVTCFPLKVGEEPIGVINVTDRADGTPFSRDDLTLLNTIANQAAAYIHLRHLSDQVRAAERLREQIEIARQIQYRLIPTIPPSTEGLEIAGALMTAERVGGDYYDCFKGRTTRPSFLIADVSGHSIGAAMIMASFRAAVRAQQDSDYSPQVLIQRVNQIMYEDLYQSEQFISMVYLQYLRSRQMIQFTSAGHPPPLLWRAAEKKIEMLTTDDPLIGIDYQSLFHEKKCVVAPGDVILLYTDGVIEAQNSEGTRFGVECLKELLSRVVHLSAQLIIDAVADEVARFTEPKAPTDDVTLLALKVL
ncbi:MAG: SpoIIE family protein phosphatase [Deltaproteobacteria bacterium]|nr:SpoIIE family protein phosphatase [Deltaproteobacteria bacterium]